MKAGTNTCTTHNIDDDVKMKKKNKKEKKKKKQVNEEQSAVSNKNIDNSCDLQQNADALELEIVTLRTKLQISHNVIEEKDKQAHKLRDLLNATIVTNLDQKYTMSHLEASSKTMEQELQSHRAMLPKSLQQ